MVLKAECETPSLDRKATGDPGIVPDRLILKSYLFDDPTIAGGSGRSWGVPWRRNRSTVRSVPACLQAPAGPAGHRVRPVGNQRSRPSSRRTVQLRREETRRGLQDLIRSPQLTILPLQGGQAFRVAAGDARPITGIDPGLLHPAPQRFRVDPELIADPPDRTDRAGRIPAGLDRQPGRTLTQGGRVVCVILKSAGTATAVPPAGQIAHSAPFFVPVGWLLLPNLQGWPK